MPLNWGLIIIKNLHLSCIPGSWVDLYWPSMKVHYKMLAYGLFQTFLSSEVICDAAHQKGYLTSEVNFEFCIWCGRAFFSALTLKCIRGVRLDPLGRMRTGGISYGIWHGIRHFIVIQWSMTLFWITMNMPYAVPYPVWKCLPYGSTHPP